MLTSDLAISFRRREKIFPYHIKTDNRDFLLDAQNLIEIFAESLSKTRGEIEAELDEYVGTGTDFKILRGLIKLLFDRTKFETSSPAEPFEIRQKVFLEARKYQPILPNSENKTLVLETVAKELNSDSTTVSANLYADLAAQQRLTNFESILPKDLLERFNLAQAQAILYRCVEMKIRISPSETANYRAIFAWVKHFGLIHAITGNSQNGYEITLTGAASLFHRSQKYGIQMSVFLPALLLCQNWKMRAEINDKKGTAFYELTSEQTELTSCYFDEPEFKNPEIEKLINSWEKTKTNWQVKENTKVIDLGKTAFVPDLVLVSPQNDEIYLDVLGFWTPKALQKRLSEFETANFNKFIIAASQELRGSREEPLWESENVLFFKSTIKLNALIDRAEKLIIK